MSRLILLGSDASGEDGPYTIGAVVVQDDKTTEEFTEEVVLLQVKLIESSEYYEDNLLLKALEELGYQIVDPPEMIVLSD